MPVTLLTKKSSVSSTVPITLSHGELAVNTVDGLLSYGKVDGTVGSLATNTDNVRDTFFSAYTDCIQAIGDGNFAYTVTGAAFASIPPPAANTVGAININTGTLAVNKGAISSGNFAILRFGGGVATFKSYMSVPTLSNLTDTFALRVGFINSIAAESTNGVFFRYTNGVNAGKWQAVARNNNVETAVDTLNTPVAGAWSKFNIIVNAAGTSAAFYINNALVATVPTNIPTGAGKETGYGIYVQKSAGTTSVSALSCDFINVNYAFTTSR